MVDVSILEYLAGVGAGAGAEIALEEAIRRARRLVPGYQRRSSPVGRLLTLLHYEFGARAGLSQDDFDDWRDDVDLDAALKEVVSGKAIGPGELAKRITPRLEGVIDGLGLAEQIADAAITLAPLAQREIPEQTSFLSNQTKAGVAALSEQSSAETKQILDKTQQILAALDQGLEDSGPAAALGRALLLGPLDWVGARRSAEQAEVAKESDPGAAAQLLGEVSKGMGDAGLEPFAEIYAAKAAESHAKAGEVDKAVALFERAAFGQVHRASSLASITIASFERAAPAEEKWRAAALAATLNWVGDPDGAVADLTTAIERSENDPRWAVELVDVLVLIEDWSALLKLGAEVPTGLSAPQEARFRLGRVEARSALGENGADAEWDELLLWAEQQGPDISGVAWQRRAMRLALDDRAEEAREAYRGAMERWLSPDGQYADQLADAFYGGVAVEANAGMRTESAEFMPLAAELRGPEMTPAARIEMRLSVAMRQLLGERFREGFFSTGQALRLARLSGSLFSTLEAMELMGRLLEAADHSDAALFYYVRAGKGKEATRVSRSLAPQDVCEALDIRGPGWVRSASYLVLKEMAGSVPEDWVAEHLELMLGDAEGPPPPSIFLTPTVAARTAISAIALQVPADQRPLVLEIVEQEFRTAMPEGRGMAGRALVLGTAAGLWDYTELAINGFLVEPQLSGVDVRWVAERASEDHAALQQLIAAAKDGSKPALEALSLIDPVPEDPDLRGLATKELGGGSLKSVKREKNQVSVGMMRIAQLGALATFVATEAVADLVERLLALTDDGEEPENHRTSAVHTLFNLIPVLNHSQLASVVEALTPLAEGKYEPAPFDHEHTDDPLAFLRLNLHEENALRAAALHAIGRAEAKLGVEATIGAAILEALQSRSSTLARGGLEAASYVAGGFDPAWIVARLDDPDVGVRLAAVRALVDREALDQGLVERILSDQVAAVRQPLLHIKGPLDLRTFVRDRMATDPDAYLRALARLP